MEVFWVFAETLKYFMQNLDFIWISDKILIKMLAIFGQIWTKKAVFDKNAMAWNLAIFGKFGGVIAKFSLATLFLTAKIHFYETRYDHQNIEENCKIKMKGQHIHIATLF